MNALAESLSQRFMAQEAARLQASPAATHLPDGWMRLWVALSVVILAYSALFPVWPILLFFLLWLPLPLLRPALLAPRLSMLATFAVPLLCLLSTLWSFHASLTLYLGLAFVALALSAWFMAHTTRLPALITGLALGCAITLLLTLLNGHYVADPVTKIPALFGLFSSKNQVGFIAELGIVSSLAVLFYVPRLSIKFLLGILPLLLAAYCLRESHSATATLTLALVMLGVGLVMFLRAMPATLRPLMTLLSACALLLTAVLFWRMGGDALTLALWGKDATLTGRTYLWSEGWKLAQEHPLLGRGYAAFWVQGEPLAERYWQEFFITARTGFHFHQTFLQAWVDLGVAGALLMGGLMVATVLIAAWRALHTTTSPASVFLFALALMFFTRAFMEIDVFTGPFGVGTFVFYALLPLGSSLLKANSAHQP